MSVRDFKDKEIFRPVWLDEKKKDAYERKNERYEEFWVDLYPKDILFILRHPLVGGKLDKRDKTEIEKTWGDNMVILLTHAM